ncbi:unnamed protein product [Angiostrongylus costaricensis]|uniref:BZIP domain-containing protein n=1 Tax=Angiostrongylus costaricensis TaxID=334426 RepID=A0A0R3PQL1_ANGCS|nr:unnamed protein product [Angiostrongylus costaricensis]
MPPSISGSAVELDWLNYSRCGSSKAMDRYCHLFCVMLQTTISTSDLPDMANDSPEDEILNGLVKAATLQSETRDHRRKARQFNRKSRKLIACAATLM